MDQWTMMFMEKTHVVDLKAKGKQQVKKK